MNTSLATRIRYLVLALCAGFAISVLGAFYFLAQKQVSSTVQQDSESASAMLSNMIQGRGALLASLTGFIAKRPHVADLAFTDRVTVSDALRSIQKEAGIDALTMTDRTGKQIGEAGFDQPDDLQRTTPAVTQPLSGKDWSGVVERDDCLMVAASSPLEIDNYVHGALISYLRLDGARAKEISQAGSLEIAFAHDGRVTGGSVGLSGTHTPSRAGVWQLTLNHRQYAARYMALPGTTPSDQMGFIVLRPLDEILAPYRQFSIAFISVLVLVALITLLVGSAFGSNLVRSLGDLVSAAHTLQRGEWPHPLVVRRNDEVGLLQSAFNEMSVSIQDSESRLLAMIDIDPLTELDNHRRFKERLEYEAARTTANGETLALLLIDIDDFSRFNDVYGHAAGDRILRQVAEAIKSSAPEIAEIARYGGEEFALVLPHATVSDAKAIFARVQRGIRDVKISGGCAELSAAKGKTEGLIVGAELALACAKQSGRNQVRDFETIPGYDAEDATGVFRALQDGNYATIKALAAAVDAKDPYTHGHSERVAQYASDLAAYVGADRQEVDLVLRSGTLHDVGKIGVPDAILQKPGKLEPEEFRIMQSHPVLGEIIVAKVPQLAELLPGIRSHHERFDGKGYPDQLVGSSIPRVARFLAVADTFDAMTSDRTYRKGLSWETALTEIERGAGTQFDPEIARAFVAMMDARSRKAA